MNARDLLILLNALGLLVFLWLAVSGLTNAIMITPVIFPLSARFARQWSAIRNLRRS